MRPPCSLQELPPRAAHFCLGVERFIRRELEVDPTSGDWIATCSGGADSTALVLVMACLARRNGVRLTIAHLDHGLRQESSLDRDFVAQLCQQMGLTFHTECCDVAILAKERGVGIEEAGRAARYAFFENVRQDCDATFICTAHHLNDLAEDVLMRLSRGAGWPGLGGLPGYDPQRYLLRPLLLTSKASLLGFLRDCGMSWREDASNALSSATRNRMRHMMLPLVLKENPNFLESVGRLWRQARTDEAFWRERLSSFYENSECIPLIPHSRLDILHQAERLRLYKYALDCLGAGQVLSDALYLLDDAVCEKRSVTFQFPGLKIARVDAQGVHFEPDPRSEFKS